MNFDKIHLAFFFKQNMALMEAKGDNLEPRGGQKSF